MKRCILSFGVVAIRQIFPAQDEKASQYLLSYDWQKRCRTKYDTYPQSALYILHISIFSSSSHRLRQPAQHQITTSSHTVPQNHNPRFLLPKFSIYSSSDPLKPYWLCSDLSCSPVSSPCHRCLNRRTVDVYKRQSLNRHWFSS